MLSSPDMIDYAKAMVKFFTKFRDDLIQHEKYPDFLGDYYDDEATSSVNQIIANLRANLQDEKKAGDKARNTGLNTFKEEQKVAWFAMSNNIVEGETLWRRMQANLEKATDKLEQQASNMGAEKTDGSSQSESGDEKTRLNSFLENLKKVRDILSVGITVRTLFMTQYPALLEGLKAVLDGIKIFHFG